MQLWRRICDGPLCERKPRLQGSVLQPLWVFFHGTCVPCMRMWNSWGGTGFRQLDGGWWHCVCGIPLRLQIVSRWMQERLPDVLLQMLEKTVGVFLPSYSCTCVKINTHLKMDVLYFTNVNNKKQINTFCSYVSYSFRLHVRAGCTRFSDKRGFDLFFFLVLCWTSNFGSDEDEAEKEISLCFFSCCLSCNSSNGPGFRRRGRRSIVSQMRL